MNPKKRCPERERGKKGAAYLQRSVTEAPDHFSTEKSAAVIEVLCLLSL